MKNVDTVIRSILSFEWDMRERVCVLRCFSSFICLLQSVSVYMFSVAVRNYLLLPIFDSRHRREWETEPDQDMSMWNQLMIEFLMRHNTYTIRIRSNIFAANWFAAGYFFLPRVSLMPLYRRVLLPRHVAFFVSLSIDLFFYYYYYFFFFFFFIHLHLLIVFYDSFDSFVLWSKW